MSYSCWEEEGAPRIDSEAVREAATAIYLVYEFDASGGNLHVVVDDYNVHDSNLDFCEKEILREENRLQRAVERACLCALRSLSQEERLSALALHDEFWQSPQWKPRSVESRSDTLIQEFTLKYENECGSECEDAPEVVGILPRI